MLAEQRALLEQIGRRMEALDRRIAGLDARLDQLQGIAARRPVTIVLGRFVRKLLG